MSTTIHSDRLPVVPDDTTRAGNPAQPVVPHTAQFPFLRPPGAPGEIGRLGNYRVLRLLGSGGMGKVFLAEDMALRRSVALKVMSLPPGEDLLCGWERFLREARALAAINHPNLVTVYQTGQDRQTIFLAMELLEGETLDARVRREAPLAVLESLRIAEQIATGLAAIHERGLIHRDIKPSNIWLMSAAGQDTEPLEVEECESRAAVARVKILDFGLVREVNADTQLTEVGVVVGTPAYMSPEQARGRPLDHRTDLFSFGCVLYAMVTGRVPFEASTPLAQAAALAADEPVPVHKLNPEIPEALSALIAQLLAKNPADRPASATDVIGRLRKIGAGEVHEAEPESEETDEWEPRQSFFRRHGVKIVAGVWLVAAILIAGGVVSKMRRHHGKDTAEVAKPHQQTPPVAPAPAVDYLSELPKVDERLFPPPGAPRPPAMDEPVRVGGVQSPHGIFLHGAPPFKEPAFISYALDKKYRRFLADVAMNDTAKGWGSLIFVVIADGKEVWRSRNISPGDPAQHFELDVSNVRVLTLEAHTTGPEKGMHGAWIEPRLTK